VLKPVVLGSEISHDKLEETNIITGAQQSTEVIRFVNKTQSLAERRRAQIRRVYSAKQRLCPVKNVN